MTKRNVMITLSTSRTEVPEDLFDEENDTFPDSFRMALSPLPEPTDLLIEGRLVTGKNRVELLYEESELSGMEGSVTSIGFERETPELISMIRTGSVSTALVFEEGKRHVSIYNTPFSDFQVCVHTLRVKNELLTRGKIFLDYLIELHGAQAEHCRMTVSVRPAQDWDHLSKATSEKEQD